MHAIAETLQISARSFFLWRQGFGRAHWGRLGLIAARACGGRGRNTDGTIGYPEEVAYCKTRVLSTTPLVLRGAGDRMISGDFWATELETLPVFRGATVSWLGWAEHRHGNRSSTCDIQQWAPCLRSPSFLPLHWRRTLPRRPRPPPACPHRRLKKLAPRCVLRAPPMCRNSVLALSAAMGPCANACALIGPSYPATASRRERACAASELPKRRRTRVKRSSTKGLLLRLCVGGVSCGACPRAHSSAFGRTRLGSGRTSPTRIARTSDAANLADR